MKLNEKKGIMFVLREHNNLQFHLLHHVLTRNIGEKDQISFYFSLRKVSNKFIKSVSPFQPAWKVHITHSQINMVDVRLAVHVCSEN